MGYKRFKDISNTMLMLMLNREKTGGKTVERREIPGDSWREEVITTAARGSTGSFGATGCLIINTECGANTDAADGPGIAPTPPPESRG